MLSVRWVKISENVYNMTPFFVFNFCLKFLLYTKENMVVFWNYFIFFLFFLSYRLQLEKLRKTLDEGFNNPHTKHNKTLMVGQDVFNRISHSLNLFSTEVNWEMIFTFLKLFSTISKLLYCVVMWLYECPASLYISTVNDLILTIHGTVVLFNEPPFSPRAMLL